MDETVIEAEHKFLESFVVILHHLHNRAAKAEREVTQLRAELTVRREQVEYMTGQLSAR